MFTIPDGRSQFYQWDANQRLKCSDITAGTEVHFATCVDCDRRCDARSDVALAMDSYAEGGAVYVDVPNQLLQSGCKLTVYAYVASGDEAHTAHAQIFKVLPRPKPDSYVYEETDVKTWAELDARILQLEQEFVGLVGLDPLLEGQDVAFTAGENGNYAAALTVDFVFAPGAEYKVFWDDEEFSCTAYSDGGVGMLGNHSLVDASAEDTVEPFVMAATGGTLMINTADNSAAHRVAIYQLPGYTLPAASGDTLGGVKAVAKTDKMTQEVGVDESGKLWTAPGSGGSGLPDITTEDNDKLLQVVDGVWTPVSVGDSAIGKYIDEYINSALEDEY